MKFLLILKAPHFLRPFVGTVQELARRGHQVQVAWFAEAGETREQVEAPFADLPGVTFRTVPGNRSVNRHEIAVLRRTWNYLRYLEQPYRGATKLRQRALGKVWRLIRDDNDPIDPALGEPGLVLSQRELARLEKVLAYVETLIPIEPACDELLREARPDVLLVSPLVDLNSSTQTDFVKAAKQLGIPVGMLVYSWDNLSTKGGLHVMPDRVFIWNRRQRDEASTLHGVPRDRLVMAGAPKFDAFLACQPRVERPRFCESLGFGPKEPIVTYLCSSAFVSGNELPFVERWLKALRSSGSEVLRNVNVIVRPHPDVPLVSLTIPAEKPEWGLDDVSAALRRPFDDDKAVVLNTTSVSPQGLYECLFHSAVAVGLNTTAEIEAALTNTPVLSVRAGDAADGQETTLHFHYLLEEHEGFVKAAGSLEEHVEQLADTVVRHKAIGKRVRREALTFVRPVDPETPVSIVLADALEREFAALLSSMPDVSA